MPYDDRLGLKKARAGALLLVVLLLHGAHLHPEDLLHLGGQRLLDVFLDAAQQEGLQLFVQAGVARVAAFPVLLLEQLPRVKPDTAGGRTKKSGGRPLEGHSVIRREH